MELQDQNTFLYQKFEKNSIDHNVFFLKVQKSFYCIITLYVDDLILAFNGLILLKKKRIIFQRNSKWWI
jgi:hypothetical protein